MKELPKEDQERIEKAVENRLYGKGSHTAYFTEGARYEHPIAYNQGFNEAIDLWREWYVRNSPMPSTEKIKEIENLKK